MIAAEEIESLGVVELADKVAKGVFRARDVAEATLASIDSRDRTLNAFLAVARDEVLAQADAIDAKRARKEPLGPLAGVPIALKDALCTRGVTTTAGSKALEHYVPAYDATVVARLRAADALLPGKTNMDEFAMGSSNENSAFGPVKNPWDVARTPGGSSGGSAVSVAARMTPAALGSDTGGSIRQPAALTGVVGMKPTYGRVPRYGLIAFASSLDQIGPFARDVRGAARVLSVIAGKDPRDATSLAATVPDFTAACGASVRGLRLGVPEEYFGEGIDPEVAASVRAAIDALAREGCVVKPITLPATKHAVATYYVIATAEASSNLARFDGVRYGLRVEPSRDGRGGPRSVHGAGDGLRAMVGAGDGLRAMVGAGDGLRAMYGATRDAGFGAEVKRRILLGTFVLSAGYYDAYYLKAQKVRTLICRDFEAAFREVDAIVSPTSPTPAFKLGEKAADPLAMYLNDIYTLPASLAGLPSMSLPCAPSKGGLPIGLQITTPPLAEERLFALGAAWEAMSPARGLAPRVS